MRASWSERVFLKFFKFSREKNEKWTNICPFLEKNFSLLSFGEK